MINMTEGAAVFLVVQTIYMLIEIHIWMKMNKKKYEVFQ